MKSINVLVMALLIIFCSCKKNLPGGSSIIQGKVAHHGFAIPFATVYIKYNAKEFPGSDSSKYDTRIQADANGDFIFKCYKGDYFLFGTGLDDRKPPIYVRGGVAVHIRQKETVKAEVAVSETH